VELQPLDPRQLENWRRRYREQLGLPVIPDLHEALCRVGRAHAVAEMGRMVGYVILAEEALVPAWTSVIPEFYLELDQSRAAKLILKAVLDKLRPKTVIGRTDDRIGFPLLMDLRLPNQISSPLYLLENAPVWVEDKDWTIVESSLDDVRRLLPLYASVPAENGGIAEEMPLAKSLAAWRHYRMVVNGKVTAVAYVVPQGQRYITVTSIVADAERRQGYGRYLAAFAVKRELSEGKTFMATLESDNEAARNLVESLGARLTGHIINFYPQSTGAA